MKQFILAFSILLIFSELQAQSDFVQVTNGQFTIDDQPYKYIGTNLWYGMYLGMAGDLGDRVRLIAELERLQELGITNLRIMAANEGANMYQNSPAMQTAPGVYNEAVLEGLDFFLVEMQKRNMKAVVCLSNFWMWSGGFPQYVSWANNSEMILPDIDGGGSWDGFINYAMSFYSNEKAMKMYSDHVKVIVKRKNSISGVKYKNDPTIMSWQLANEPRGYDNQVGYRSWINQSAAFIQKLDKSHLVCIGSEGNASGASAGVDLVLDNQSDDIDYATTHVWIQNWGWFNPTDTSTFQTAIDNSLAYLKSQAEKAKSINKPLVIEEFGVSRNGGSFLPEATVTFRDRYYKFIFDYTVNSIQSNSAIQGCNFWSWGGMKKANNPGGFWKAGDDMIGDPAHEKQGWYSVYNDDTSTTDLILKYTNKLSEIQTQSNGSH